METQVDHADRVLGTAVILLDTRGEHEAAATLELASLELWEEGRGDWDVYTGALVTVHPVFLDMLRTHEEAVARAIREAMHFPEGSVTIHPALVDVGWREARAEESAAGISNQAGRLRLEDRPILVDGYKFRDAAEVKVYEMLKVIQAEMKATDTIAFVPNVPIRTRHRIYEVDFLVTRAGRAGVIEVDGDTHRRRFAADASRDDQLRDAGVREIHRIPVEVTNDLDPLREHIMTFLDRLVR